MNSIQIDLSMTEIRPFCEKWRVTEFSLFGSVLAEDFRPDSDVNRNHGRGGPSPRVSKKPIPKFHGAGLLPNATLLFTSTVRSESDSVTSSHFATKFLGSQHAHFT